MVARRQIVVLLLAGVFCAAPAASEDPPQRSTPDRCWDGPRADRLEQALDTFLAESDASRRKHLYRSRLTPAGATLSLDELVAMAKAAPPSDRRVDRDVYRVDAPWRPGKARGDFLLALPKGYTPARAWPLVVALHGASGRAGDIVAAYVPHLTDRGCMVLLPTISDPKANWSAVEERANVYRAVAWVARRYRVDFRRLIVSGVSMGGSGCWSHLLLQPEIWSAAAPVAGYPTGIDRHAAGALTDVPLYILHGTDDATVPIEPVRRAVSVLRNAGIEPTFVEARGTGHAPPPRYWAGLHEWVAARKPKRYSPRPLLIPPTGRRPLWEVHADPLGLKRKDPTLEKILAGQAEQMRGRLQRALLEDPDNARIRLLLAFAWVPGLLDDAWERPGKLAAKSFGASGGWTEAAEFQALANLAYARRAPHGKEGCPRLFDASTHVLAARIYARRFLARAHPKSVAWVDPWNRCMGQIKKALRANADNADVIRLLEALKTKIPADTVGRPRKRHE